jgi:hypothetical protein
MPSSLISTESSQGSSSCVLLRKDCLASTSVPDRRSCSDAASALWAVCWRNGPGDGGVECTAAGKLHGGDRRCGPGVGPEVRLDVDVLRVCAMTVQPLLPSSYQRSQPMLCAVAVITRAGLRAPPLPWVVGKVRRSRVRINRTTPSRRFSGASQNACIGTFPRRSASQWYVWQQTLNLKSALLKPGSGVQVQDAVWAHAQNGRTYRAASHHTLLDVKYAIAWSPASTKRPPSAIDERTALGPRGCGRAVR